MNNSKSQSQSPRTKCLSSHQKIVHGVKLRPMVPKIGLKYTYYLVEKDSIKYNCCEVCLHG
jgi:hypothetical protein